MSTAREEILARIRAALPAQGTLIPLQEPAYQRRGGLDREACLELLRDRLLDYNADVVDIESESELPAAIAAALTKAGKLVSVAGGGDTVSALNQAGVADDFTYVSTAGGAFLEWMEG